MRLTASQIQAVKRHLYEHEFVNRRLYNRNEEEEAIWLMTGDDNHAPAWVNATFGEWVIAFRDEDWAFLAQWLPYKKTPQFKTLKKRNEDIDYATRVRAALEKAKVIKRKGSKTPRERVGAQFRINPRTVPRIRARADEYESQSKTLWLKLLGKNR